MRIHLLGPSGSGTTTLGSLIAQTLMIRHLDADSIFWLPTDPPFTHKRGYEERKQALASSLDEQDVWVLSGSVLGWGDFVRERADLLIYKYVEPETRISRLRAREARRHGPRIEAGGDMEVAHREFIAWALSYESGGMDQRSRLSELTWLEACREKVLVLEGQRSPREELDLVLLSARRQKGQSLVHQDGHVGTGLDGH